LAIPGEGSKLELDEYIIEMVNIRNTYGKKIKEVLSFEDLIICSTTVVATTANIIWPQNHSNIKAQLG